MAFRAALTLDASARPRCNARMAGPTFWCWKERTALRESDVEARSEPLQTSFVKLEIPPDQLTDALRLPATGKKVFVVVWSTVPWTLAGCTAVTFYDTHDYALYEPPPWKVPGELWVLAKGQVPKFLREAGCAQLQPMANFVPREMERRHALHPFLDRKIPLVVEDGNDGTPEYGTGVDPVVPGHSPGDYALAGRHGLERDGASVVDAAGVLTAAAGPFATRHLSEADAKILETLRDSGHLAGEHTVTEGYPRCRRCGERAIARIA